MKLTSEIKYNLFFEELASAKEVGSVWHLRSTSDVFYDLLAAFAGFMAYKAMFYSKLGFEAALDAPAGWQIVGAYTLLLWPMLLPN